LRCSTPRVTRSQRSLRMLPSRSGKRHRASGSRLASRRRSPSAFIPAPIPQFAGGSRISSEVTCIRCGERRWPTRPTEPYTCQRCREALAGGRAIDPLPTDAQRAARAVAQARLPAPNPLGKSAPGSTISQADGQEVACHG